MMAAQLLDERSVLSGKSELELFSLPPTQIAVDSGYWHEIYPKNTLSSSGPYLFHITSDPAFMDFSRNYIYMELKITKSDGSDLDAANAGDDALMQYHVAPINLIGKSFFRTVKFWLNNKLCYDSNDLYAYRSYLETLLNYGTAAKKTHLQSAMYYPDTAGKMETRFNAGWYDRANCVTGSRTFEVMAPIHVDIFQQEKLLLNYLDAKLELHRNTDKFCLMSFENGADYKLEVLTMRWYVRKVNVLSSLALGIESQLLKDTVKYAIRRTVLKTIHVEGGRRDLTDTLIFSGQIPRRILVAFVDPNTFYGTYATNPFNFKHHNIKQLEVTAGGVKYPRNAMTIDFDDKRYTRAYVSLFETLNVANDDKSNGIQYTDYANGYFVAGLDLSPDGSDAGHWELIRDGSTYLKVSFDQDISAGGLKVIIFGEFDNMLALDTMRNVYYDYSL